MPVPAALTPTPAIVAAVVAASLIPIAAANHYLANEDLVRLAAVTVILAAVLHLLGVPTLIAASVRPAAAEATVPVSTKAAPTPAAGAAAVATEEVPAGPDPYADEADALSAEFLKYADDVKDPAGPAGSGAEWVPVVSQKFGDFSIEVHQKTGCDFFFRNVIYLQATPEEAFDLMADIERRPEWDDICQEGKIVEQVSNSTVIQYFRTRGLWPTAPRDALVLAFTRPLEDGRYLNVTKSIPSHPAYESKAGDVRMLAHIAGQVVGPDPEGRERMCKIVQVVNGDLGGWLPKSVVALVTTQAIPVGMRKANKMLKAKTTQKTESEAIRLATSKTVIKPVAPTAPGSVVAATSTALVQTTRPQAPALANKSRETLILDILRRAQPWVVVSLIFALIFRSR
ncbi:hypothetical protein BDK51DRAFT_48540 [Blyttiomyces helicus]|uniref:START domain-containing protein n=1 Tax=Blyttiomyces helicus TaxID=388810 RepID=A0A4P9W085_9FUNG|nr:hypothetical protein BDK51DRAFT_48540 [Blyttiomyces helicus]|eukprot:RKO83960.1 hypothetical protein BDK51DRAFT_48540 [Blyttiomyces helicus]